MSITAVLCATTTVAWWVSSRRRPEATPVLLPTLAWLIALALASAFAIVPEESWRRVGKALFPLLVPLAGFHASNPRLGRRAIGVLLATAGIAATIGLVAFVARGASFSSRARGLSGHYMTFGGQLLLLASVALGIALVTRSPKWRWGAGLVALATSLALVCTYTRSAWLGFAAAAVVIVGVARTRWLPALILAVGLLYVCAPTGIRERLESSFQPNHPNNLERTRMWEAGWRMFQERPWTGVGLQDLRPIYARYRSPEARETPGHLHSHVVQIAASMGIVGLAAFVWLFGSLFAAAGAGLGRALAHDRLAGGLKLGVVSGLLGFFVAGAFEWNFGDEELLYLLYVLVGMAWGAGRWATPIAGRPQASPRAGRTDRVPPALEESPTPA